MNLKSQYKPFVVGPPSDELILCAYNDAREFTKYSKFSWFNHWPMSYVISEGHFAWTKDRTSSTFMFWMDTRNVYCKKADNLAVKLYLTGVTKEAVGSLPKIAKFWLQPPKMKDLTGAKDRRGDQAQKAYVLEAENSLISFNLIASEASPLINPCFLIRNWNSDKKATLKINSKKAKPKCFCQGIVRDINGKRMMVIWIEKEDQPKTEFEIGME